MSITITYRGEIEKFQGAVREANLILMDIQLYDLIIARNTPFDESNPADLSPTVIADLLGSTDLNLELREYQKHHSVGGAFDPRYPNIIWGNTNAVPYRSECYLAATLIHECIHALSFHNTDYDFSHDGQGPSHNQDTAPYWIGNQVFNHYCKEIKKEKDQEPIIVEKHVPDNSIIS